MKNRFPFVHNSGMFAAVMLGMLVCTAAGAQGWRPVASESELVGRWEGSQTVQVQRNTELGLPRSSFDIRFIFECLAGKDAVVTVKLDFNRFLNDWVVLPEVKEAGITKDQIWAVLMEQWDAMMEEFVFENYTVTFSSDAAWDDFGGDIQISRNRRKIRFIFDEPLTFDFGFGDEGITEMVLDKKS